MTNSILSNHSWMYRGEGNANLVLSLPESRLIIRIKKTDNPKTLYEKTMDFLKYWFNWEEVYNVTDLQEDETQTKLKKYNVLDQIVGWMVKVLKSKYKNVIYTEVRDLKFYKDVIRHILGVNYACDAASIYITKKQAKEIECLIENYRPEHRKSKRLCYGRATIFEDFALLPSRVESRLNLEGPTYSIEIKPKQGWYPVCERLDSKCQFCSKQYLKIERGQIEKLTSYCPLDLFSGNKTRMLKAIRALIDNPQNNLKVFMDGQVVYGENFEKDTFYKCFSTPFSTDSKYEETVAEFCDFIYKVLTNNFLTNGCEPTCNRGCICDLNKEETDQNNEKLEVFNISEGSCAYTESKLPRGCVLERIYQMQKLNDMGLAYYSEIYKGKEIDESMYSMYIDELLAQLDRRNACPGCLVNYGIVKKESNDLNTLLYEDEMNLLKYLMFSIARDCSLMITFRKIVGEIREPKDCIVKTNLGTFAVNVGVIDLSPKPLTTITKAIKRNEKIAKAYKRSLSNTSR